MLSQPHLPHRMLWGDEDKVIVRCSEIPSERRGTNPPPPFPPSIPLSKVFSLKFSIEEPLKLEEGS